MTASQISASAPLGGVLRARKVVSHSRRTVSASLHLSRRLGGVPHLVQKPSDSWGYAVGVRDVAAMIVGRLRRVRRRSSEREHTRLEEGRTVAKHAHDNDLERFRDQTGQASGNV
jgi:hypothetical protein